MEQEEEETHPTALAKVDDGPREGHTTAWSSPRRRSNEIPEGDGAGMKLKSDSGEAPRAAAAAAHAAGRPPQALTIAPTHGTARGRGERTAPQGSDGTAVDNLKEELGVPGTSGIGKQGVVLTEAQPFIAGNRGSRDFAEARAHDEERRPSWTMHGAHPRASA